MGAQNAVRYFHALRHFRPSQVAGRLVQRARYRLYDAVPITAELLHPVLSSERVRRAAPVVPLEPGPLRDCRGLGEAMQRADRALRGEFGFLGIDGSLATPIDWRAPQKPKLWRYHLHYLDAALDLALAFRRTGERTYAACLQDLLDDWTRSNPVGCGDGWEPYPLSMRIPNWLMAIDLAGLTSESAVLSVARQALFLEHHVEWHLRGNHVLANLTALVMAGCAFEGESWARMRRGALGRLREEFEKQVPEDGLHYELSPEYHALVLLQLARAVGSLRSRGEVPPDWLCGGIRRMSVALNDVLHPDGEVPLLGDSPRGHAPPKRDLLDPRSIWHRLHGTGDLVEGIGAPLRRRSFSQSGLEVSRSGGEYLVCDLGPVAAKEQPAHGHSDTLGFELSHAGRRLLVDAGTSSYEAGAERDYFRSARAHNVVTVGLEGPDEIWAAFRLGRRSRVTSCEIEERDGVLHVQAELRAYQGWRHRRDLVWDPRAGLIVVDRVYGAGLRDVRTHLHLHPSVEIVSAASGFQAGDVEIESVLGGSWESFRGDRGPPLRGWYAETLGPPVPASEIALTAAAGEPRVMAYVVSWAPGLKERANAMVR